MARLNAQLDAGVIVVMDMENVYAARELAASPELGAARGRAGTIGPPDGGWLGPAQIGG